MSTADGTAPLKSAEARALFADLAAAPVLVLAVSGGSDSTALLLLAARWSESLKRGPKLIAVTVDHGLRPEAKAEARAVGKLAGSLGVAHRTLRWTGRKPKTGIQEAAREARYRLLADAARKAGARHVVTAHTFDDQAETVLIRLLRGSGLSGLAAMAPSSVYPLQEAPGLWRAHPLWLERPLLGIPKDRLLATLKAAKISFASDPSNADPHFTRVRLRALMPTLAREGLTAERLVRLARRIDRSELAINAAVEAAANRLAPGSWSKQAAVTLDAGAFFDLPDEIALRLLGWVIGAFGDEGPVELGKLERFHQALAPPLNAAKHGLYEFVQFRRTLAGALVTLKRDRLIIERAPPRRRPAPKGP